MQWIAEGTWVCGDPGVQYEDTIQRWHTCKNTAPINSSNPCSEYMFLDDSACNLASLNLMKFLREDGAFDVERFRAGGRDLHHRAGDHRRQRQLPDRARSRRTATCSARWASATPTSAALLMALGLPYDSDEGRGDGRRAHGDHALPRLRAVGAHRRRTWARSRATRRTASRCSRSCEHAPRRALDRLAAGCPDVPARGRAAAAADEALELGQQYGYRNAQVTVLAPTGTIGFMMDCDTTGVEPDIALVKYKLLAGGGMLKIVNRTVPDGARSGWATRQPQVDGDHRVHRRSNDTIEGAPGLKEEHLPVFDCAFKPRNGKRYIPYMAHLRMMAAVQPFLSGAISKTVNMPTEATVDEIMQTYIEGWKLGLKAVAIYRDGCKRSQPVNTGKTEAKRRRGRGDKPAATAPRRSPLRRRMPTTRQSLTHKFDIAGHEGYLTVGLYEDGSPGELFITMAKEGSTVGGLMDSFGTAISLCLQYGVPLKTLVEKFAHTRFEPSGFTKNPDIPIAKSLHGLHLPLAGPHVPGGLQGPGAGEVAPAREPTSPCRPRRRPKPAARAGAPRQPPARTA